jgi:hypothetical protein
MLLFCFNLKVDFQDYKWQSRHHKAFIINSTWQLAPNYSALSKILGSLDANKKC